MALIRFYVGLVCAVVSISTTAALLLEHGKSLLFVIVTIVVLTTGFMWPTAPTLEGKSE